MNRELSPELWRRISEKLDGALGLAPHPKTMETLQSLAAVEESRGRMWDAARDYLQVLLAQAARNGAPRPGTGPYSTLPS